MKTLIATTEDPDPRPAIVPTGTSTSSPDAPTSPAAIVSAMPRDDPPQGSKPSDPAAMAPMLPTASSLLDPALALAAEVLDDIERVRIANENRVRQMTRSVEDSDGEQRGFGYPLDHPDVKKLAEIVANLARLEHDATLNLQRKLRKHPLAAWAKAQKGVGEKQVARLLAAIGDPYINSAKDQPRTVSALWAYCGLHVLPGGHPGSVDQPTSAAGVQLRDTGHLQVGAHSSPVGVAAKRRKGERANWSTKAKMRAYLIAESCIKQLSPDCRGGHRCRDDQAWSAAPAQDPQDGDGPSGFGAHRRSAAPSCACSPYRVVYDLRRAHTAVTHPEWTDGHSHNDALRVASKALLRDLWRAARDYHLGATQ